MTRLTARAKKRKKQPVFQKLWAKAEKLKRKNALFRKRLDAIIHRMRTDLQPVEEETARLQIPLLRQLLTLGQRKSLAKWQRQELDSWIRELLEPLQSTNHIDSEILEDISRYDAFSLGIELDDSSSTSLADQLRQHLDQEKKPVREEDEASEESRRNAIEKKVEQILKRTFGPEPPRAVNPDKDSSDFFQDELNEELERQYNEYHKTRNAAREKLLGELLAEDEDDNFFDFDFGFDLSDSDEPFPENGEDDTPAISNAVFKRLFRSTAGRLHPDRESDPVLRKEKQALMAKLLSARKQGDVMTVLEMHQQYGGDDAAVSRTDEKQLIGALKQQINELECEQEEYSYETPLHRTAFEQFYHPTKRKTDQAFKQYIQMMEEAASESGSLALSIKSIKTLKPHLEQRYEESRFANPFEALDEFFRFSR